MAHNLDFSKGFAAFAYVNEPGWHRLGNPIAANATVEQATVAAGADFEIWKASEEYKRLWLNPETGKMELVPVVNKARDILYRSDTGARMNNVTKRYKIVQPKTIIDWIFRLCRENGYTLETLGVICEGARYFALCKTANGIVLPGQDKVSEYICATTSCDGSTATECMQTSIRVVCNNTLDMALHNNVLAVKTRHSKEFNPDDVQIKLGVGKAWADWSANAARLTKQKIKDEEVIKLLFKAYHPELKDDAMIAEKLEKDKERMSAWMMKMLNCLKNSPGADLASARGTLWGAVNAVTYDIDHNGIGRTDEARFIASQWNGAGAKIKARMWEAAVAMAQ